MYDLGTSVVEWLQITSPKRYICSRPASDLGFLHMTSDPEKTFVAKCITIFYLNALCWYGCTLSDRNFLQFGQKCWRSHPCVCLTDPVLNMICQTHHGIWIGVYQFQYEIQDGFSSCLEYTSIPNNVMFNIIYWTWTMSLSKLHNP